MDHETISKAEVAEWVKRYTQELYRWALHKTSDPELAEDLVQETFLAAVENLAAFKRESQPKTWLFGILKNKIAGHFRESLRRGISQPLPEVSDEAFFDLGGRWEAEAAPSSWDAAPENLTDSPGFNLVFDGCIMGLPLVMSACIRLKYLDKKKGEQICQELGLTTTNYWQLVHRAKLQLRQCLEKLWFKHA